MKLPPSSNKRRTEVMAELGHYNTVFMTNPGKLATLTIHKLYEYET